MVQVATAPASAVRAPAPHGTRAFVHDALMAKVAAGDKLAFASLYDQLSSAAYGLAQRVVRNPALAEEITQDAFLQVWSTCRTFDSARGSAQSWVLTIVHRRAVDVVRHEQSARDRVLRAGLRSVEPPSDTVWATALQRSEREQVLAALASLTASQRQAIELAYYEGMTCREVATRLQIPVGTVKSRIHEGVRRIHRALIAADR